MYRNVQAHKTALPDVNEFHASLLTSVFGPLVFLVAAFQQNERVCYSGKLFSSDNNYAQWTLFTELLNYWTGKRNRM